MTDIGKEVNQRLDQVAEEIKTGQHRVKRHFADGRRVLFISSVIDRTQIVATAIHPDWALRIAEALNDTDPFGETK